MSRMSILSRLASGTWTVKVTGTNVPESPQPYALVVDGAFDAPLAVTLSSFLAEDAGGVVEFRWRTAMETGTAGFHVFAQTNDGRIQLTDELIPSPSIDSVTPTDYSFSAATDATIFYLHELRIDGSTAKHGPFEFGVGYGAGTSAPDRESTPKVWLPMIQR